jgi:hypothetical protein
MSIFDLRREPGFGEDLAAGNGWYHSMEFADGTQIEGYLPLSLLRER